MYSSAAINIDMNGRVCGALVQFGFINTDMRDSVACTVRLLST